MGNVSGIGGQGDVVGVICNRDARSGLDGPELEVYSDLLLIDLASTIAQV